MVIRIMIKTIVSNWYVYVSDTLQNILYLLNYLILTVMERTIVYSHFADADTVAQRG